VPNFRYRALTRTERSCTAPSRPRRPGRWHIVSSIFGCCRSKPLKTRRPLPKPGPAPAFSAGRVRRSDDFTRDPRLLLRAGARLDDALELLGERQRRRPASSGVGNCGPRFCQAKALQVRSQTSVVVPRNVCGTGFASAKFRERSILLLEMLGMERARAELMRRKLTDAMPIPGLRADCRGLRHVFFILFVLPQFSSVLQTSERNRTPR